MKYVYQIALIGIFSGAVFIEGADPWWFALPVTLILLDL